MSRHITPNLRKVKPDAKWLMRVGVLREDAPSTWVDKLGNERKTPLAIKRPPKMYPVYVALEEYVLGRDGYSCCGCGKHRRIDQDHDPDHVILLLDHIISLRNGGSWHPSNLQSLCESCNAAKSTYVDRKARVQ